MSNKFFCCFGFFIAGLNFVLLIDAIMHHWGWMTIAPIVGLGLALGFGQGFYNYDKINDIKKEEDEVQEG